MGFSSDLFQENVDEEFICSICMDVFEDPVQVFNSHLLIFNIANFSKKLS